MVVISLRINHHCIICDTGYDYCNDCNKYNSWRKVACSHECYLTYLAYLDYRDLDHDAAKFAQRIDQIGIVLDKLPPALKEAYELGLVEFMAKEETEGEAEKTENVEATKVEVVKPQMGHKNSRKK